MADPSQIRRTTSDLRSWDYEPGNGTRYELVAVNLGPLGDSSQWLVSLKNMGGSMLVWPGGYLSTDYVAEKLAPRYGKLTQGDLEALAPAIMALVAD